MNKRITHLSVVSDYSAIGHYRILFPEMRARTVSSSMSFIDSSQYLGDRNLYSSVRTVKIQRPFHVAQYAFIKDFLKPLSDRLGFWIMMDVDDCLVYEDVPKYNIAREMLGKESTDMLRRSMDLADVITVTTNYIRDYYVSKFDMDVRKFVVIPNYLPRWWIGNCFNPVNTLQRYENSNGRKLKIAFVCGGNHYDLNNANCGVDDFTGVVEWIRKRSDDYEFHFVGGIPLQLLDLAKSGKIVRDPGCDILNYPYEIYSRGYGMWICPLQDNVFNRCKSNIKLLESWAMGIPVIVQDCECYRRYTPDLFSTADELDSIVSSKISDPKGMIDKVLAGRRIVDHGDNNSPNGWWLENNMSMHNRIFTIPQKTMKVDMNLMEKING